jgi:AraC-like DNA-binding protein
MNEPPTSQETKFWRVRNLNDLELNHAHCRSQEFPRHFHEEYVIGVMEQGLERVSCGGTVYVAGPGTLILFNPGQSHASSSIDDAGFARRMFYPAADMLRSVLTALTGREQAAPVFPQPILNSRSGQVASLLMQLHIGLEQPSSRLEQESEFAVVIERLVRTHALNQADPPRVGRERTHVRLVRDFLEAHYAENLSLTELASVANLSTFHLLRAFREEFGLPPFEYQNQVRLARARQLLRQGMPIARVASEIGYSDQSHMTKHFKRFLGITPGKYANRNNVQDLLSRGQ